VKDDATTAAEASSSAVLPVVFDYLWFFIIRPTVTGH
jgi:hypothetical protein